jgi:hypothetical protein
MHRVSTLKASSADGAPMFSCAAYAVDCATAAAEQACVTMMAETDTRLMRNLVFTALHSSLYQVSQLLHRTSMAAYHISIRPVLPSCHTS